MMRTYSALLSFLVSFAVHAQEIGPGAATPADSDFTAMFVVILIFIAMIGGFGWFIWREEQKRKRREAADGARQGTMERQS